MVAKFIHTYLFADALTSLPCRPGVYWLVAKDDSVLYVGKAKSLRNRISSYRRVSGQTPRTRELIKKTHRVRYQELGSDFEAQLVEARLIQAYQPAYNIQLKDDKSPIYIVVTSETFPQVKLERGRNLSRWSSSKASVFGPFPNASQARAVLKTARRIFPYCSASATDKKRKKACFYFHLGQCPGVCVGEMDSFQYKRLIRRLKLLLSGKVKLLSQKLAREIHQYSRVEEFEKAAVARDQLQSLQLLGHTHPSREDFELPVLLSDQVADSLVKLRALLRQYLALPVTYTLQRIEGYDISNLGGDWATGAMVVFMDGASAKDEYRKFKIRTLTTSNDVGMLEEVIRRRFRHAEWETPNLVVVDGGRGQLRAARSAVPSPIPVVGLAKDPDRLVVITRQGKFKTVKLPPRDPATHLLQHIRDESHRFAKKYHTKLRSKALTG